ncbi:hypothetical protein KC19_VG183000 [Ceratodon purpureus]|uniref:Uncharacterized protein n=1 Tax=Ceratodon purpureus TaxID=3225 RepID=A0A8T0HRD8_CERPU|nr:hypothetical protein KC19_VG183000 [Ceratodon purpureus]
MGTCELQQFGRLARQGCFVLALSISCLLVTLDCSSQMERTHSERACLNQRPRCQLVVADHEAGYCATADADSLQ